MIVGTMILVLALVGIVLSYRANQGLPFVPSYEVRAAVPDAAELTVNGSEVRVGGARVGVVTGVKAMPPRGDRPAYAVVRMALETREERLPVDTRVTVRPRSILGAKYVDLVRGHGRPLPDGATLPLAQAKPVVELDEAFKTFGPPTSQQIQRAVLVLGDALAGRGQALNDVIRSGSRLMPGLERVLRVITSDRTNLSGFIAGADAATSALAPVAGQLGTLFDSGATTLRAVDAAGPALGRSIEALPGVEAQGTTTMRHLRPVLADATAITRGLTPGTRLLPSATARLDAALRTGTPVLKRTPDLARRLKATLASLGTLSRDPSAPGAVRKLTSTVTLLGDALDTLGPAQERCNVVGLWTRNVASVVSEGDANGTWFNFLPLVQLELSTQQNQPYSDLHLNPVPHETDAECEVGNEPYAPGRHTTNPAGDQANTTQTTSPPKGAAR